MVVRVARASPSIKVREMFWFLRAFDVAEGTFMLKNYVSAEKKTTMTRCECGALRDEACVA